MSQPFVGEIRMFAGTFAPAGWAICDGRILPISEYTALFSLIGTTYGGNGQTTFGLPDLRSRIPVHFGTSPRNGISYQIGQVGGEEEVQLTVAQMPAHGHQAMAQSAAGNQQGPGGGVWADSNLAQFTSNAPTTALVPTAISSAGSNQPHPNIMPYQAVNFIISLFGIFPSRN